MIPKLDELIERYNKLSSTTLADINDAMSSIGFMFHTFGICLSLLLIASILHGNYGLAVAITISIISISYGVVLTNTVKKAIKHVTNGRQHANNHH